MALRVLIGILMILGGVFNAAAAYTAWHFEFGWWLKDEEPSDVALIVIRIGGIVAIIFGVICLIFL